MSFKFHWTFYPRQMYWNIPYKQIYFVRLFYHHNSPRNTYSTYSPIVSIAIWQNMHSIHGNIMGNWVQRHVLLFPPQNIGHFYYYGVPSVVMGIAEWLLLVLSNPHQIAIYRCRSPFRGISNLNSWIINAASNNTKIYELDNDQCSKLKSTELSP